MILMAVLFVGSCPHSFVRTLNDSLLSLSNAELGNYYLKKAKGQKKAAWVMCGGGLALATIGAGISMSHLQFDLFDPQPPQPSFSASDVMAVAGVLIAVGSIPFFIAGAKNKKRQNFISTISASA